MLTLIHHAANRRHHYPPGSISAIKHCLDHNAYALEIDVLPIADGNFLLLHDPDLAAGTNGRGNAATCKREELQDLYYVLNGIVTSEKIGFLDEVIDLVAEDHHLQKFQLDFKPFAMITPQLVEKLMEIINPILDRVQISTIADWALRAFSIYSAEINLGFDPLLYLDIDDEEPRSKAVPPFRVGAYGLRDDHPLSAYVWGSHQEYLKARAEVLLNQAVQGCEWFIRAETLLTASKYGFDWIAFLHENGCLVDTWTLDPVGEQGEMAAKLVALGVDEITTNDTMEMSHKLNIACRY